MLKSTVRLFCLVLLVLVAYGEWVKDDNINGDIFSPRSGHTAVALQDKYVLIYGGHVLNGFVSPVSYFSNEVWIFTKTNNSMVQRTQSTFPPDRTFHGAVELSNTKMLIWGGGTVVGFSFLPDDGLWVYDLTANSWTQLSPTGSAPSGRLGHSMVRQGNKVFVFGGIVPQANGDCCDFLNDMYSYSISHNQWSVVSPSGDIPSPRGHAGAVVRGNAMWLQGGEGTGFSIEGGLWRYNIGSNKWVLINEDEPDVNQRESQLFNVFNNGLICFGGDTEGPEFYNLLNDTQIYKFTQDEWELQSTPVRPPTAKRMPSVALGQGDNEEVWFFGGNTAFDPFSFTESNHNEVWYWTD